MSAVASLPVTMFGPVNRTMLALYAAASGDHNPIHIDLDFARASGQPDVFVHGMLGFGLISRYISEWAGQARLRRLDIRFAGIAHLHDVLLCTGTIAEHFREDGRELIRIAVQISTQDGRITMLGQAIVDGR